MVLCSIESIACWSQDQTVGEEAMNATEIGDFIQIGLLQRNVDDI